jgi:hypothetical protein
LLSGTHPANTPFIFAPLTVQQPVQLASLIARMVEIDANKRPASMAIIKDALQRMVNNGPGAIVSNPQYQPAPIQQVNPVPKPSTRRPKGREPISNWSQSDYKTAVTLGLLTMFVLGPLTGIPAIIYYSRKMRRAIISSDRSQLKFLVGFHCVGIGIWCIAIAISIAINK